FQAEDGIRDDLVTGVQTCALPILRASGALCLIVRTQWLFGAHGRCFPRTMWERATARSSSRVVRDQVGHPTCSVDLARATWSLRSEERRVGEEGGDVVVVVHCKDR